MGCIGLGQEGGLKHGHSPNPHINSSIGSIASNTNIMDSIPKGNAFDPDFPRDGASGGRLGPSSYHTSPTSVDILARGRSTPGSSRGKQAEDAHSQTQRGHTTPSMPTPMPMAAFPAMQDAPGSVPLPMSMPMATAGIHHATAPCGADVSLPFIRPTYVDLNANRVSPAGPHAHPDPNFRPIGVNNWTEILHDHTLLQYLSNSNIKEIKDHVGVLGEAIDPSAPASAPVLIAGGPYNTDDATAVWKYCDAYMRRRGQERNNRAARRSRARKESETLHWRRIALAAGAEDREFEYDAGDPAYGEGADAVGALPRETAGAIRTMRARWDAEWAAAGGGPSQLALPRLPPPGFSPGTQRQHGVLGQARTADHALGQINQQVYDHTSPTAPASMYQAGQQRSNVPLPTQTRAQTRANARRTVATGRETTGTPVSPTTAALGQPLPHISEFNAPTLQGQNEGGGQVGTKDGWDMFNGSFM